jgi:hypothetical protein
LNVPHFYDYIAGLFGQEEEIFQNRWNVNVRKIGRDEDRHWRNRLTTFQVTKLPLLGYGSKVKQSLDWQRTCVYRIYLSYILNNFHLHVRCEFVLHHRPLLLLHLSAALLSADRIWGERPVTRKCDAH